jgi:hypothetical protein
MVQDRRMGEGRQVESPYFGGESGWLITDQGREANQIRVGAAEQHQGGWRLLHEADVAFIPRVAGDGCQTMHVSILQVR